MRRSKVEHYIHLVWATKERQPLVTPQIERDVYRCISSVAQGLRCVVHAIGGMPDHIHLVVWIPTTLPVAELMKRVKGVSSAMVNDLHHHEKRFRWQEGYS